MPSRRERAKGPPDPPPVFFVDRSLGRYIVPEGLRDDGWTVEVMADVYGERVAQGLDDPPWIADATRSGQVILTGDYFSLRYRPPFITVKAEGARVFALDDPELSGEASLARFRTNMNRIVQAARKPGPYIYKVREQKIDRAWP